MIQEQPYVLDLDRRVADSAAALGVTWREREWNVCCDSPSDLPRSPGVYRFRFCVGGIENTMYVGMSRNLRARVATHFGSKGIVGIFQRETSVFVRINYIPLSMDRLRSVESFHIQKDAPFLNNEWKEALTVCDEAGDGRLCRFVRLVRLWQKMDLS